MAEEIKENKMQSRKFLVWIVWLLLSVITLSISIIVMIVTKSFPETVIDLLKIVLENFFYISAIYLGANCFQKVGFAIADVFAEKKEDEK